MHEAGDDPVELCHGLIDLPGRISTADSAEATSRARQPKWERDRSAARIASITRIPSRVFITKRLVSPS